MEYLPLEKTNQCTKEETIGSALAMIESSHEPVFVFSKDKKFLGLVAPYYTLFRKRFPYTTKVESVIMSPPKINPSTPAYEIAAFMTSTRIYALPVFKNLHQITGVITAKNLIRDLLKDREAFNKIIGNIEITKAVTAPSSSMVREVYKLLRQKGTTRVILVDEKGKLNGIVSRKDIEKAFIRPTNKQRYSTRKGTPVNYSMDQETITRFDVPVSKFCVSSILFSEKNSGIDKALRKMIEADQNSIVLIKSNRVPQGIISKRNILKAIAKTKPEREISIIMQKPRKEITDYEKTKIYNLIQKFAKKMDKISSVRQVRINFKKSKTPAGGTILFNIILQIDFYSGKHFIAEAKDRKVETGIREAIKKIEKQERRHE